MKEKGFTLIELLAVIVVLAIIALIAVPMVLDTIEKSRKGAASSSTYSYVSEVETKLATYMLKNTGSSYSEGKYSVARLKEDLNIELKGTIPTEGNVCIGSGGTVAEASLKMNNYIVHYDGKTAITTDLTDIEDIACNGFTLQDEEAKVYGIKRSLTTDSSTWERTDDAVGLVANAQVGEVSVQNDFDSIYPWSDIISYNYNTDTKQITAWYGEDTFTFDGSNGEVLTYIPEFYYKRIQENGYEYISISKKEKQGYTKSEAFSVGRYTMSGDTTRVHSRSGYKPLTNHTISDFRTYARNLGEGFGQLDYHYFILQLLYLVEYADYNSQAKLGLGNANNTAPINSGQCDILGMHSGSTDGTDNTSIIYRGVEDIFGNVWQFVDGINIRDYKTYICYDSNQYAVDTFSGSYKALGYTNASIDGYASKLGYDSSNPMVALTTEAIGDSNTNMSDYYRQHSGDRIALVGGSYENGLDAGLWYYWFIDSSSCAYVNVGARLIKIG